MIRVVVALTLIASAACTEQRGDIGPPGPPADASVVAMAHADTFAVYERAGYHIVDFNAPVVSWGGDAKGANQTARVVLAPKTIDPPALTGDLEGAVLVRTPVARIAVNYGFLEAVLTQLDVEDRLVAVGGVKSYNDAIRARSRAGELSQIGYGWHAPPMIDPLLGAEPDVFFMVLGDLGHAEHYDRIKDLGVPVVPIFFEAEPHYMGPVDYVRLMGLFTGREAEADAFANRVAANVDALKAKVADRPRRSVISAWFGGGGRWMATVRNAENQLLEDAGGVNPLAREDDIRLDDFMRLGSEVLLEEGRDADCWIIRDTHAQTFTDVDYLENFRAWREGCLFASDASNKPEADAFDIYETGPIRPDLLLNDVIGMLHPEVHEGAFVYVQPDAETPRG
ncbi:MAG: ABC transporter substrate-binding protein [Caulobacterales bacterium]|nr:ABC transporter substrate-binding protein [Caulobacterales bacterium]